MIDCATELAAEPRARTLLERKQALRAADEQNRPLETYRVCELAEMSRDIFEDRNGFARARHAFLTPAAAPRQPSWLRPPGVPLTAVVDGQRS